MPLFIDVKIISYLAFDVLAALLKFIVTKLLTFRTQKKSFLRILHLLVEVYLIMTVFKESSQTWVYLFLPFVLFCFIFLFFVALYSWLPETEIRKASLHSLKQILAAVIDISILILSSTGPYFSVLFSFLCVGNKKNNIIWRSWEERCVTSSMSNTSFLWFLLIVACEAQMHFRSLLLGVNSSQ